MTVVIVLTSLPYKDGVTVRRGHREQSSIENLIQRRDVKNRTDQRRRGRMDELSVLGPSDHCQAQLGARLENQPAQGLFEGHVGAKAHLVIPAGHAQRRAKLRLELVVEPVGGGPLMQTVEPLDNAEILVQAPIAATICRSSARWH